MIYTESELQKKIYKMIEEFESEVVEFKEVNCPLCQGHFELV